MASNNNIYNHCARIRDSIDKAEEMLHSKSPITHHYFPVFDITDYPHWYYETFTQLAGVFKVKIFINSHSKSDGFWVAGRDNLVQHVIKIMQSIINKVQKTSKRHHALAIYNRCLDNLLIRIKDENYAGLLKEYCQTSFFKSLKLLT